MKIKIFTFLILLLASLSAQAQYAAEGPRLKYAFGKLKTADGQVLSDDAAMDLMGYMDGSSYHYARMYYKIGAYTLAASPVLYAGGYILRKTASTITRETQNGVETLVSVSYNGRQATAGYALCMAGLASALIGGSVMLVNRYKLITLSAGEYGIGLALLF